MNTKATIVIPVWNGAAWLAACLDALAAQSFRDFAVIVVDNGSTDNSRALVARHAPQAPQAALIAWERNRGFAAAVNAGIRASRTEYVALLNVDTSPRPDWLANLVQVMDKSASDVGALASKMLSMADPAVIDDCGDSLSWQGAAAKRGHGRSAAEFERGEEIFSPCAGAALYRKSFLDELGGFDERFFAYLEDVDLGLRGRLRGYRYLFVPSAEVLHQGHGSGLPQARYVRLITRNRILLLLKNLPVRLLIRHAASLLYGQIYFFIAYRRPLAALAGYFSVLPVLPHIVRERRAIQKNLKLTLAQVEHLLTPTMNEPRLRELARRWWRG
ncbi:MAG: glycosyltransferase family 2 protein [Verrucomicrobia bacterium]|nr:glycosyltransferase family 2 protein [Verrucomicrobiota bacterium]MBU1736095.1 glycosyltransferase family 2 protein [Verrucomicrobiota bacterium]MBU1857059.1 glycosyltransferase family 2 protein [Verrucomicrobiota bacterium]